ncbi:MAG: hypothetical protein EON85_03080 [Brevundimonas sp.]|nr:MAG: hypothetical protein EON85_03080 [Brevundimonas sp.]
MKGWLPVFAAALVAIAGGAQAADVDGVIGPIAGPSELDGQVIGCDLSFHVGRGPSHGDWREAIGATVSWLSVQGRNGVSLKIGYQPGSRVVVAPVRAFLGDEASNNAGEIFQEIPSDGTGYTALIFVAGDRTVAEINNLHTTGVMKLGIEKPDGELMIWTLDLTGHPGVRTDWERCLSTLP